LKVGNTAHADIERIKAARGALDAKSRETGEYYPLSCDSNTGWLRHEAM
jgi:hypothetical protein